MSYLLPETPIVQILFSLYTLAQCVRKSGVVWNWYDCQRMFPWSANRPLHRQRFLYLAICRQMPSVWFWSNWELATKCYHSYSSLTSFLPSRVIWVWSLALNTIIRAHSSSHTRAEGGLSKIGGNTRELAVRLRSNTFYFFLAFCTVAKDCLDNNTANYSRHIFAHVPVRSFGVTPTLSIVTVWNEKTTNLAACFVSSRSGS